MDEQYDDDVDQNYFEDDTDLDDEDALDDLADEFNDLDTDDDDDDDDEPDEKEVAAAASDEDENLY